MDKSHYSRLVLNVATVHAELYCIYVCIYRLFYMFEVMYVFRGLGIVVVRLLDN